MVAKLSKIEIEKPFTSHEQTLREMYVIDGFVSLMNSLIEATRIRNDAIKEEDLKLNQGELNAYKKILVRAERAFKISKENKQPLEKQDVSEVKI